MSVDIKRIVEALIFVSEAPLPLAQIAQVLETEDKAAVEAALAALMAEYQDSQRAFTLVEVAGGYVFRTRPELAFWLRRLKRDQVTRLSRAALESLAIIAYKQPVMKAEIERLRGVEVGGVLRMLMEKDLVRVVGRKDLPGRPLIYGTTRRFLEVFDLKDLKDLPTLEEMEALAGEADSEVGQTGDLFARGAAAQTEGGEDGGWPPGLAYEEEGPAGDQAGQETVTADPPAEGAVGGEGAAPLEVPDLAAASPAADPLGLDPQPASPAEVDQEQGPDPEDDDEPPRAA